MNLLQHANGSIVFFFEDPSGSIIELQYQISVDLFGEVGPEMSTRLVFCCPGVAQEL